MKRLLLLVPLVSLCLSLASGDAPQRPRIIALAFARLRVSDVEKSRQFYTETFQLGFHLNDCVGPHSICFRWNTLQKLELTEGRGVAESGLLERIGFSTDDLDAMRRYLVTRGLQPGEISKDWDGQRVFYTQDPEGHSVAFVSPPLPGSYFSWPQQVGGELIHAGFVVHDRAAQDRFYKDILGFHVYWHGGMKDGEDNWVDMQVPDGTDWIEYMLRVSPDASHKTLGVMNHIALGVPDIHAAQAQLIKNGWKGTEEPKIGRDGKWQLNLYDPDDTRVELMEFTPVEKPCCSEYTGPHPKP
jgi:catechol 2,3-dioxygenase-like lactoylglutathione lyase family enzyme